MAGQVVKVRREKLAPYMTCFLCKKLLKEAITISLCLHSFCRKCIYEKLSVGRSKSCPVCDIKLGRVLVDKLRPDHDLQDIRANIFPSKRRKIDASGVSPSFSPPPKMKERSFSPFVSWSMVARQVASTVPPASEKVATKGEILPIEVHQSLAMKKRKLEEADATNLVGPMREADYHPCWNLRAEEGRLLLDIACCWVQGMIPPELSRRLMKKPLPEIFKWIKYHFPNFLTYNRASVSHLFEETELHKQKLVDNEASLMKQCGEFKLKLSKLRSDHDAKLKEQADFYEAKLKEQAQYYDDKVKSLESEVFQRRKDLADHHKVLEQLHGAIEKNKSIEMLCQLGEDSDAGIMLKETMTTLGDGKKELGEARGHISLLYEQANMIHMLQQQSHRAGMEEGVKRAVRAVQSASPYVNWDQIHISENTLDEDREALQRAFVEGIITGPTLVSQGGGQDHVIIF